MDKTKLKRQTISGLIWKFAERMASQITSIIVTIILARLLLPEDYGAIALILVFVSICDVIVVNGLASPLIQKKDADHLDFSTIFHTSLTISIVLYVIIYLLSPFVADFYEMSILCPALRVLGLRVIISSISSVQNAYVSRHMQFRKFFYGTISGTIVAGVLGILMAYKGYGLWALVVQSLSNQLVNTIIVFIIIEWRPQIEYSRERLKSMWSYGWKIFVAALVNELFQDIRTLLIGKVYTKNDLSYYNQGNNYPHLVVTNINSSIISVLFPAIAKIQDNYNDVRLFIRRSVKTSSFVLFPLLFGLASVSDNFVSLVLTNKWLPCVPYMQIICLALCLSPISAISQQALKAIGRSDVTMKQEMIKKSVGLLIIIISIQISVFAVVIGTALSEFWFFLVNTYPCKKILKYSYREQILDIMPNLVVSVIMAVASWLLGYLCGTSWLVFILQILVAVLIYVVVSFILKNESLMYLLKSVRK